MSGGLLVILGDRHSPLLSSFFAVSEVTHLFVAAQYLRTCAATMLGRRRVERGEAFEMYDAALVLSPQQAYTRPKKSATGTWELSCTLLEGGTKVLKPRRDS